MRQTVLGHNGLTLVLLRFDDLVRRATKESHAEEHADTAGKVRQTNDAGAEAVLLGKDKGKCAEEKIQDAVDNGNIQRQEDDGRQGKEHLHGPNNGTGNVLSAGNVSLLKDAVELVVSGRLPESLDLGVEQGRRVCLAKDNQSKDGNDAGLNC